MDVEEVKRPKTCCGKTRTSNFCEECGTNLRSRLPEPKNTRVITISSTTERIKNYEALIKDVKAHKKFTTGTWVTYMNGELARTSDTRPDAVRGMPLGYFCKKNHERISDCIWKHYCFNGIRRGRRY